MDLTTARQIAARIWCDQDYSHVVMDVDLAEKIAIMLMNNVNSAPLDDTQLNVRKEKIFGLLTEFRYKDIEEEG